MTNTTSVEGFWVIMDPDLANRVGMYVTDSSFESLPPANQLEVMLQGTYAPSAFGLVTSTPWRDDNPYETLTRRSP